ncbi:alpha-L-rhamnosidase-related protein [Microbacterium caowuchunii]|uniref:Bacterial alpha-L-rhamnosidase n=1 Tax=Microbacterium caowuchunii TaxID=2614638 RepID=A0A5N0TBZ9_9MICO|nr:alpha-L-rhamnosidase C-terminal domain-containing protein [Microbacterium caowuchunii]KAA9132271.1 Bacterial alpha-L-rhamnosidase [Microbacterium caowuchunii]
MTTRQDAGAPPLGAAEIAARSLAYGADVLPDRPESAADRDWYYPYGEYETAALHRMIAEGFQANRHVDYAGNAGVTTASAVFRATAPEDAAGFRLRTTGPVLVHADGAPLATAPHGDEVPVPAVAPGTVLAIRIDVDDETVPAAATLPEGWDWECSTDGTRWLPAVPRPGDDEPPHLRGEPVVPLPVPPRGDGIFALPGPVLGRVEIVAEGTPVLGTGESVAEALADPRDRESRTDLQRTASVSFLSSHALGLRYASVTGADVASVTVHAQVRPALRRGGFLCDDVRLNRIWATSAYTLRLCLQTFLLDGIKRDRMPWMGDHALGVLTNAYAFADGEIVRNTLLALGRPRGGYVNGISDYSLWWVISHGMYQRHFGDRDFALSEADHIDAFVADLARHADADGVLRPPHVPGSFEHTGAGDAFLDWGVTLRPGADSTALQTLWHWALTSAATVLAAVEHPGAERWTTLAATLERTMIARAWNPSAGVWRDELDGTAEAGAYPNFLAALAGVTPDASPDAAIALIRDSPSGTPFMRSFALMALGRLGARATAVAEIGERWGHMLDAGATTFWEDFDADGSPLEMYGRPYGKSLCHAWSAGPAALLPELVLGIRPLSDGWARFTVDPELGHLRWAAATVPTPHGDVVVEVRDGSTRVDIPDGATLVVGDRQVPGPGTVHLPLA